LKRSYTAVDAIQKAEHLKEVFGLFYVSFIRDRRDNNLHSTMQ